MESVAEELNRTVAADRRIRLEVLRWETDAYPGFHIEGPQGICDEALQVEDCDVLVGIFWTRFGTPTPSGMTGTEHEINRAVISWQEKRSPQVMVFFNTAAPSLRSAAERRQWALVAEYREKFPSEGLFWEYDGSSQFEREFRRCLANYLREKFSPIPSTQSVGSPADVTGVTALRVPSYRWTPDLSPAALLRAEYAVVPFFGRQQELADITSWATSDDSLRIRLYIGEGGFGKTRLAIEACRRLREAGFAAGFLPRKVTDQVIARVLDESSQANTGAVIVIDYVEIDQQALVRILGMLRERRAGHVRILLLARGAGQWWDRLKRQRDGVGDILSGPATDEPLRIAPLAFSTNERRDLFRTAASAFGELLRR